MSMHATRREFVERAATTLSSLVFIAVRRRVPLGAPLTLRVGRVPSSPSDDQRLGYELGLDEARRAASLFGGVIEDVSLDSAQSPSRGLSAIIGGGDTSASNAWIRRAAQDRTLYMNVGCTSDALRGADCSRAAFHVAPSDAMLRDAAALSHAAGDPMAWSSTLARFGADTLNQRFTSKFRRPMTSSAWASWFAVKILWESALRARSGDAEQIASYLTRATTQFDGHKGSPLSFRAWDHQLRQPLYVVARAPAKGIVEVPTLSADTPVRDALDQIGIAKAATQCTMRP